MTLPEALDALRREQNARRAAEEQLHQLKLLYDPQMKADEKAKLLKRRAELVKEIATIDAAVSVTPIEVDR